VTPYEGGTEIPIPGRHESGWLLDSATIALADVKQSEAELSIYNFRTRQRTSSLRIADVRIRDFSRLGKDSWVWVPLRGDVIRIQRDGEARPREVRLPSWYKDIIWLSGSPDGRAMSFVGWKAPSEDSMGVGMISLPDGKATQLYSGFAEDGTTRWLDDGSLLFSTGDTPESSTFYRARPGAKPVRIGSTPRPTESTSVSSDEKRAIIITRDNRRDAWMMKVVR
jgi:hypothetical protein